MANSYGLFWQMVLQHRSPCVVMLYNPSSDSSKRRRSSGGSTSSSGSAATLQSPSSSEASQCSTASALGSCGSDLSDGSVPPPLPPPTLHSSSSRRSSSSRACAYYPPSQGQRVTFGTVTVANLATEALSDDTIVRTLRVQDCATKASHTVTHYHYVSWPDFGAPSSPQPLLQLSRCLDQHRKPLGSPIVVHCKAGIGRSGTFCALDIASHRLRRLWRGRAQASDEGAAALVDVRALVLSLRQQRVGMVQTRLQYRLVYEAVARELGALLLQQASCM